MPKSGVGDSYFHVLHLILIFMWHLARQQVYNFNWRRAHEDIKDLTFSMPLMSKPFCLYFCYKTAPPNLTSRPACIVSQLVKMSNLEKYVSLSPLHPDFDSHFGVAAKQSSAHCAKSFWGFYNNTRVHPPTQ